MKILNPTQHDYFSLNMYLQIYSCIGLDVNLHIETYLGIALDEVFLYTLLSAGP